jgi:non-specific serine/threonine protein kinase/serine/threonine-protein kinase
MGSVLQDQGKLDEAEKFYREALEGQRRVLGDDHEKTLSTINNMGSVLEAQRRFDEALVFHEEALERKRRVLGEDHPVTISSLNNMGTILYKLGRKEEAEAYWRENLEKSRRVRGNDHIHTLIAINNMGFCLMNQGKLEEAEPLYREALERFRDRYGDDHPTTLVSVNNNATLLYDLKRYSDVITLLSETEASARGVFKEGNVNRLGKFLLEFGKSRMATKQFAEAEQNLLEAYGIYESIGGADSPPAQSCIRALADLYDYWHEAEPTEGFDAKSIEWRAKVKSPAGDQDG